MSEAMIRHGLGGGQSWGRSRERQLKAERQPLCVVARRRAKRMRRRGEVMSAAGEAGSPETAKTGGGRLDHGHGLELADNAGQERQHVFDLSGCVAVTDAQPQRAPRPVHRHAHGLEHVGGL